MQGRLSGNHALMSDATFVAIQELVLDTNVVLDLWLFGRPSVAPLRLALHSGAARWLASPAMLTELAHVHQRPHPPRFEAAPELAAPPVLLLEAPTQGAPWRCADRSDQAFLDLAWQRQVPLWTRDRHLLSMRRKAHRGGLVIETPEEGQSRLGFDQSRQALAATRPA